MRWERRGLVFCPDNHTPWMRSHAANPVAEPLEGDLCRVYFNCRDEGNRSSIGSLVIDLNQPQKILELDTLPVLGPGQTGLFDDAGVSLGNIVRQGGKCFLFYTGWMRAISVPWMNAIGLAVAEGDGAEAGGYARVSRVPILDRSEFDPFSLSYPWVCIEEDRWRMWYGSNLAATPHDRRTIPHAIKYAESDDGITWRRTGQICVGGALTGECAFSRPCVLREDSLYRMWYSRRDDKYIIGYAESEDGLQWTVCDEAGGLTPSGVGWESESTAYPCVMKHAGQTFLFYNGDDYGRTGFGLAVSV